MPKVKNTKYRVKIENLPEGFELLDGELVKKAHGGYVTGSQHNYGLTTFNPHAGESKSAKDTDVRYSLSSVPRDMANIEAEGGETVLTDLNNDGQFGLYNITGPRHTSGGVPMFLPEQSFIYSDTKEMKMGKEMLSEYDIKSRKKITPAKVSKKFDLNKYYGILNDQYTDKIQANTAELMLQKNKESLSKLAFGQEMMKQFEDGVPLAAYPYIKSIGLDPFEFSAKIDGLKKFTGDQQAAQMNPAATQAMNPMAAYGKELPKAQFGINGSVPGKAYFDEIIQPMDYATTRDLYADTQMQNAYPTLGLTPYEQRMQELSTEIPILQNQTPYYESPTVTRDKGSLGTRLNRGISNVMESPEMDIFKEISRAGVAGAGVVNEIFKNTNKNQAKQDMLKRTMADSYMGISQDPIGSEGYYDTNTGLMMNNIKGDPSVGGGFAGYYGQANYGMEIPMAQNGGGDRGSKRNIAYDPETLKFYEGTGIDINSLGIGERAYVDVQPQEEGYTDGVVYGDASKNIEGFAQSWDGIYPETQALLTSIRNWDSKDPNPDVEKFQRWINDTYIPQEVDKIKSTITETGGTFSDDDAKALQTKLIKDYGFGEGRGRGFDGDVGTFTSSRRPISFKPQPPDPQDVPCEKCSDGSIPNKDENGDCLPCPEIEGPEVPDVGKEALPATKEPWIQDIIKAQAIADRERDMLLPWQPGVRRTDLDVVLQDPTRGIAGLTSQAKAQAEAIGAFAGPQSTAARTAETQGKLADSIADYTARVNSENVQNVNRAQAMKAQLESQANMLEDTRAVQQYDDTMKTLQTYMDEKNFDREQYADSMANLITNMSDTYNVNQLYDYFNINPLAGGDITKTDYSKEFSPNPEQDQWAFMNNYMEAAKRAKAAGLTDKDGNVDPSIVQAFVTGSQMAPSYTDPKEEAWKSQARQYMAGNTAQKKGGEPKIKKWAIPFYTGKMGI